MWYVLILYISDGNYNLMSTLNERFFEKLFMAILFTLRAFVRNLLRGNRRRNTFRILFWCLAWGSTPGLTSNKPTHYLLDHGDFNTHITYTHIYTSNIIIYILVVQLTIDHRTTLHIKIPNFTRVHLKNIINFNII